MGRSIKTNINMIHMGSEPYDSIVLKSLVKSHPLVILDNIPGKSYYPIFDDFIFEDKKKPLIITHSWSMGGGTPDLFNFFFEPKSNLYLPSIIINGIIGQISFELAKKVFNYFKSKIPNKRQPVIYYSEKEQVTYYEFPSETSLSEFEKGIDEIPKLADKEKLHSYFIRSLKIKKWIKEDNK